MTVCAVLKEKYEKNQKRHSQSYTFPNACAQLLSSLSIEYEAFAGLVDGKPMISIPV